MEITYERNLMDSYMLLPAQWSLCEIQRQTDACEAQRPEGQCAEQGGDFQKRMILENDIRGFLPIRCRGTETGTVYEYQISSRVSLQEYTEHTPVSEVFLKQLIFTLCRAVEELGEYLLSEEHVLLGPETIFVQEETAEPFCGSFLFCLYPDQSWELRNSLRQLIKFLMEKTDRTQGHCAELCYELYGQLQKENFCLKEFRDALERWSVPTPAPEQEKKKGSKQLFARRRNGGIMKPDGRERPKT